MPLEDMEIIPAIFAGSVIREGFGRYLALGHKKSRAVADPAWIGPS
jgi:hypothetical protein